MSDRCQICGDVRPRSLEEHHILPRRFGGGDHEDNLVRLCASCHRALESIYDKQFWTAVGLRPSDSSNTVAEFADRRLSFDESYGPSFNAFSAFLSAVTGGKNTATGPINVSAPCSSPGQFVDWGRTDI